MSPSLYQYLIETNAPSWALSEATNITDLHTRIADLEAQRDRLREALKIARTYIRGEQIEFAVINHPYTPKVGLGEHLDAALKENV